jgi:hypothetical protein
MPRKSCVRLDVIGSCVLFLALLSLIGPLLLGHDLAWPPWLFVMMGTGVFLFAALWWLERLLERRGGLPLVHLGLLTDKSFATGLLSVFFFTFANISFYLVMTLYMQLGLGFTPLQSGAVILPLTLAFALASRRAGPRAQRRGATALIEGCGVQIAGVAVVALAVALNGRLHPIALSCLLILFGIGQGMVMAPLYGLVLSKVPSAHAGSGAGVVSTIQQVGNAAGVAAVGSLYFAMQAGHSDRYAMVLSLAVLAAAVAMSAGLLGILRRPRAWSSQRAP